MGYNQLFLKKPSNEIIIKILCCFGLINLDDATEFSQLDMEKLNTIIRLKNMESELSDYYLPCKKAIYLTKWNYKNCITICRQFLKTVDMTLYSREKYIKSKKYLLYKLITTQEREEKKKSNGKVVVTFD